MIWDLPKQCIVVELWFDFWLELGLGLGVGFQLGIGVGLGVGVGLAYKDFIYAQDKISVFT